MSHLSLWEVSDEIRKNDIADIVKLLEEVISYLPPRQSEFFDSQLCYPGFLAWNSFWKNSYSREIATSNLDALSNVHIYYENWIREVGSKDFLEFQKLWEIVMIRSTSEAICETVGSMMNQHGGIWSQNISTWKCF